jgi:NAD(P)-dependent dehydrogenase (short-subunit alcohol dehydrogenase family)
VNPDGEVEVAVAHRLEPKVVLVTGGSTGIGRAVARRAASEGAAVVLAARREDVGERTAAQLREAGARALFVSADVTSEAEATAAVEAAVTAFGRLDGAFNNAGGVEAIGPLTSIDAAAWQSEIDLNLTSVFNCMKAEIAAIRATRSGGAIVNNASVGGVSGIPGLSAYTAAKHGVVGLTKSVALECASDGIRVNCLVTGNVDTPLYRRLLGVSPAGGVEALPAPNPTGRVATADEIAGFVTYLLSDEAAFVTGAALAIDGGATAQ